MQNNNRHICRHLIQIEFIRMPSAWKKSIVITIPDKKTPFRHAVVLEIILQHLLHIFNRSYAGIFRDVHI